MVSHELCETTATECVRPHSKCEDLFALIAMADQQSCLAAGGFKGQLLGKPALSDPRLTHDRHHPAPSPRSVLPRRAPPAPPRVSPPEPCPRRAPPLPTPAR